MSAEEKTPHSTDVLVGTRLRARRKFLGISQTGVADALGLTFQQVQKYERGVNRISASKLYEIAKFLTVNVEYFFEGLDETAAQDLVADPMVVLGVTAGGPELAQAFLKMPERQRKAMLRFAQSCADDADDGDLQQAA